MDNTKEMSKIAFNQQALTYDKDIKGQHARTLYPYILNMLKGRHFFFYFRFRVRYRRTSLSNTTNISFKRFNRYRYI